MSFPIHQVSDPSESKHSTGQASSGCTTHPKPRHRRSPSPDSPQPYQPPNVKQMSSFPDLTEDENPLSTSDIKTYIRRFNSTPRTSSVKMTIWSSTKPGPKRRHKFGSVVVLRLTITNVLVAYLTLDNDPAAEALIVESVRCFGPRETVRM
jgi:hypothetical protein